MNTVALRSLYEAAPFQPFDIVLTNGTTVRVAHPEFLSFAPDEETIHVYEADGRARYIDVKLIVALNTGTNGARPRKRKR
ncbi:MAG TPA: hypothetical protein VK993_05785 [Chthoniobacterales bacterium]|nr:hypothetical protein [Chthoniobacterales bacterium]